MGKTLPLMLSTLLCVAGAQAASFDCRQATATDERAICASRSLSDKDVEMATKYQFLRGLFAMGMRGNMQDDQTRWLAQRNRCGNDVNCLSNSYATRIAELDAIYQHIDKPL
ncbi:lysozyme inhibitor LprI family protein [Serratia odorifera]|uniref:Lysozyme inhibitor LprI-like N-terminal domain-containing protein n=2 Tax=Serratia odorifera TaxID=618 RepID=D4E7I8_SEROD|nr:hypothetical protein [Serratia odorifera]EFE94043.1 hypothetical protein HMPREF0758_4138 [Serratia odorifera DSM 4582]MBJ2063685.1 hypothetical protein [Serratia odorifera]PNK89090.1 hypothetical protein CEQ31_004895 [Serratia odorifera]RII69882.1 hypothetical protein DX901_21400 [Serratia odorifera]VDZ64212.1 Uncharacterized protein conserved in bacteria, putative lipoprotein [Serratia odorifera]